MCFIPGGCRNRIIACRAKCFWSTVDPALGIDRKTKPRSAKHITGDILPVLRVIAATRARAPTGSRLAVKDLAPLGRCAAPSASLTASLARSGDTAHNGGLRRAVALRGHH